MKRKDKPAKFYEIFYKPLDGFSAPMNMTGPIVVRFILMIAFILYMAYGVDSDGLIREDTANYIRDDAANIVIDRDSRTQWQNSKPLYKSTYLEDAIAYCSFLYLGGHADWRLPNQFELNHLGSNKEGNWTLPLAFEYFSDESPTGYWSTDGFMALSDGDNDSYLVRCIRDNKAH